MEDDETAGQDAASSLSEDEQRSEHLDAATSDAETVGTPERRRGGTPSGWLRGVLGRLPTETSAMRALPSALDGLAAPSIPPDALSRAVRAGELIVALAPGAPPGVVAPEGAPRVGQLVGRDERLADALSLLEHGRSLCVHSAGAPGAGKTTFAVEIASRLAEQRRFPGGIVWISCESLGGDDGLAEVYTRVAHGLRIEQALTALDPDGRRAALSAALSDVARPATLLALATVEPTLDMTTLLDALVGNSITLVVTALKPVDDVRLLSFALAPLDAEDAARLFAQRLRLRDARRPSADDEALLTPLSEALGCLPLAIELVAALAGVHGTSLQQAHEEAQSDLARGESGALRALIERLWQSLDAEQRRALSGLTLIAGATFPRAVALAVARAALDEAGDEALDPRQSEGWRAAQALDGLIGLGSVEAMAAGRLRLHPLMRRHMAQRLGAEMPETRQALGEAMANWWLDYARSHQGFEGDSGLEAEAAGLMGALTWAHAHGAWRLTLDLAEALGDAWRARGRRVESLRIAQWAVEAAEADGQPRERYWASYQLAATQTEAGRAPQALAGFTRALALARDLGDPVAIRDGAHALAALAARTGDVEAARAGFTEALAIAREMNDAVSMRDELHGLAILNTQAERLDEAREEYTEALALARRLDDDRAIYLERYGLALVELRVGALAEARAGFAEALALAEARGDTSAGCDVLVSLGATDAQLGELEVALEELAQALALAEEERDLRRMARALVWLAEVEAAQGDQDAASGHYQRAHALYDELGDETALRVADQMRALSQLQDAPLD